jgi:hypothetical protein
VSNAQRPSTARKRTPKDEAAREAALDEQFTIRVDEVSYTLSPADITGLVEMRVRKETGMSVMEIITKMQVAPGMDLIGCFMYACEVGAGRDADLEKILGSVSMNSDFDVVDAEGDSLPQP